MGRVDVDAMLDEMTADELLRWAAYYAVEPFGEDRADLRVGILSSMVANAFGSKKTKPGDFVLSRREKSTMDPTAALEMMAQQLMAQKGKPWRR